MELGKVNEFFGLLDSIVRKITQLQIDTAGKKC
jgi:hypothetical protein